MRLPVTPGAYAPGSMAQVTREPVTGSKLPTLEAGKCNRCLACWIYCPDSAIRRTESAVEIVEAACKGCGICATECSEGAITMMEVS